MDEFYVKMNNNDDEKISATEYFQRLKNSKQSISDKDLIQFYNNCLQMKEQFEKTEQIDAIKKLVFLIETVTREKKVLDLGINQYVFRNSIDEFIEHVSKDELSFIELSRYERIVPDDIIEKVEKCKDVFDNMYVLFTDYSQTHKKKYEREHDPILFGVFEKDGYVHDRFYFIGDWVDEYCDLTLDKFATMYEKVHKVNPVNKISALDEINLGEIGALKHEMNSLRFNTDTGKYEKIPEKNMIQKFIGTVKGFFK